MLVVAIAAIVGWLVDRSRFEKVLADYGQHQPDSHWEELFDGDIEEAVSIGEVTLVYRYSDIVSADEVETKLDDLCSPAVAERNGRPDEAMLMLIKQVLGFRHELLFANVQAEGSGDAKFWKVAWELIPESGFLSGFPGQYVGYVRADGSTVSPRIYLRDYFGSWYAEKHHLVFSVIPIEKLLPVSGKNIDERELIDIAESHLNKSLEATEVATKFRFDKIQRQTYSSNLLRGSDKPQKDLEVWAVEFVDSSIPQAVNNNNSATKITVWVTSDLQTSKISVGGWSLQE